jgi:hypothetical protein
MERDLAKKKLVVQKKLRSQDALLNALFKQIASCHRRAPEGVFRVGLMPNLKLLASLPGLKFIEKVKAGVELRNVQGLDGSLPGSWQRRCDRQERQNFDNTSWSAADHRFGRNPIHSRPSVY